MLISLSLKYSMRKGVWKLGGRVHQAYRHRPSLENDRNISKMPRTAPVARLALTWNHLEIKNDAPRTLQMGSQQRNASTYFHSPCPEPPEPSLQTHPITAHSPAYLFPCQLWGNNPY